MGNTDPFKQSNLSPSLDTIEWPNELHSPSTDRKRPYPNVAQTGETRRDIFRIALVVALTAAACLDVPVTPRVDPLQVHCWTVILESDSGKVWIAQTDTANWTSAGAGFDSVPAKFWVALDGPPSQPDLTLWTFVHDGQVDWHLDYHTAPVARGTAPYYTDTNQWVLRADGPAILSWDGGTLPVRFNAIADMPMPTEPVMDSVAPASIVVPSGGIVSLRVDDCHAEDSASLRVLGELNLVAEFAVPSRLVGQRGECTSGLLAAMVVQGSTIESHSRYHTRGPSDFAHFYMEAIGSAEDLRAMGYHPHDFIQPGSWSGDFYFDSPAKLSAPAGALLRQAYVAVEAYAYQQTNVTIPPQGEIGPAARSLRSYTAPQIDLLVRQAAQSRQWIEFMWHSGDQPAADLKARLSAIAALRDSGYVTVMPFYRALHAAP